MRAHKHTPDQEDCKKVNIKRFWIQRNEIAFETFVGPEAYTQCFLLSNSECQHNFKMRYKSQDGAS